MVAIDFLSGNGTVAYAPTRQKLFVLESFSVVLVLQCLGRSNVTAGGRGPSRAREKRAQPRRRFEFPLTSGSRHRERLHHIIILKLDALDAYRPLRCTEALLLWGSYWQLRALVRF